MRALSLYLDTSVIGGYFDAAFMADTRALWRLKEAGRFRFVSSVLVDQEIAGAPERVRALLRTTIAPEDVLPMNNAVNVLQGYPPVRIVAPTFLIHGQQEKDH